MTADMTARSSDDLHVIYDKFVDMVRVEPVGVTVDGKLQSIIMTKDFYDDIMNSNENLDFISKEFDRMLLAFLEIRQGRTISADELYIVFCSGTDDEDPDTASKSLEDYAAIAEAKASLYRKLAQARNDCRNGRLYTSDEVRAMLHAKIASRCSNGPAAEELDAMMDDADAAASVDERLSHEDVFDGAGNKVHKDE